MWEIMDHFAVASVIHVWYGWVKNAAVLGPNAMSPACQVTCKVAIYGFPNGPGHPCTRICLPHSITIQFSHYEPSGLMAWSMPPLPAIAKGHVPVIDRIISVNPPLMLNAPFDQSKFLPCTNSSRSALKTNMHKISQIHLGRFDSAIKGASINRFLSVPSSPPWMTGRGNQRIIDKSGDTHCPIKSRSADFRLMDFPGRPRKCE